MSFIHLLAHVPTYSLFLSASQRLGASSSHFVVVLVLVLVMFNFQTLEIIKYRAQIPPVSELEKI